MMKKVNYGKAVVWGFLVMAIDMMIGNLLYLNPLVSGIFGHFEGHPSIRTMEYFGGMENFILLQAAFGVFISAAYIALYLLLFESIPGTGWKKGLSFGLLLGIVKVVPEAFNQWMLFNYPAILIETQLVNSFISLLIFSLLMSVIFSKFNVVRIEEKQCMKKIKA